MREADVQCFAGAQTFVDTEEALQKSGDLLDAMTAGTLRAEEVQGTLATLCRAEHPGRSTGEERNVFKAVGSALEDLTAATLVWQSRDTT
jgi:ornithine cyclodeaminase